MTDKRITAESSEDDLRREIARLQSDLNATRANAMTHNTKRRKTRARLDEAAAEIARLREQLAVRVGALELVQLRSDVADLRAEIARKDVMLREAAHLLSMSGRDIFSTKIREALSAGHAHD